MSLLLLFKKIFNKNNTDMSLILISIFQVRLISIGANKKFNEKLVCL